MMTSNYDPADVLIHVREPYSKNTVWIQPTGEDIEIKLFDKGWRTIFSTKDTGLSENSLQQVQELIESLQSKIDSKLLKQLGKENNNSIILVKRQKELETKINELEAKVEKLTTRYSALVTKLNTRNGQ